MLASICQNNSIVNTLERASVVLYASVPEKIVVAPFQVHIISLSVSVYTLASCQSMCERYRLVLLSTTSHIYMRMPVRDEIMLLPLKFFIESYIDKWFHGFAVCILYIPSSHVA